MDVIERTVKYNMRGINREGEILYHKILKAKNVDFKFA